MKYCSQSCRSRKPGLADHKIEAKIASLLETRQIVSCDEVQASMCDDETVLPIPISTVTQPATQGPSAADAGNDEQKREAGQKRAERRELIRRAARRAVVFGLQADDQKADGRRCEAVQNGRVVEPSFAKGDFAIRWRS